ncbi:hypothetical protein FOLKNPGA_03373 [Legionella sp. PC1000]|uniref:hypothetical protein n=1 Tax=Legionella sp. PC1000 TaxID=2746060 RepID=UPI0015F96095|nr:hypothetical protein [Legionella sp. PC1000]QLZ70559.1 hypothetical protein FOLKNPGA_03373 [Legionella sp. PC1000]
MKALGLRCSTKEIIFAVYDNEQNEVITIEPIKLSNAFSLPQQLHEVRVELITIIKKNIITHAGIRTAEPIAKINLNRVYFEGVILESFAECNITKYYKGPIATISSKIGIPKKNFKLYTKGLLNYEKVNNWDSLKENEKEALLTAIGAINA